MSVPLNRREFLRQTAALAAVAGGGSLEAAEETPSQLSSLETPGLKLGLVTYNLAMDWDLPTLLARCRQTGFQGIELRTTHRHGVEPTLTAARRREVRQQFEDSGLVLWGLGTTCEFHSPDPAVVQQNIATCRDFVRLARDLGARGVKVRPNGLPREVPEAQTLQQIGRALRTCGEFAADQGVEIWVEVHGEGTSHPPRMRTLLDHCSHPQVGLCWNSNPTDLKDGSLAEYFDLLRDSIRSCHINELWREDYPWRDLFRRLKAAGYHRFTLAEIPPSPDAERLMRYYRALWKELTRD